MASLFVGTVSGLYSVSGGQSRLLGLPQHIITHLSAGKSTLLAAVPERGPVHDMLSLPTPVQRPGLHASSIAAQQDGASEWRRVWEGDARSCCLSPSGAWFVGTEPADVLRSSDEGATWRGSNGFRGIPSRASWSFPAPPHKPHVLSLEAFQQDPGGGPLHVVAGIEVGGALLSKDGGETWQERNSGLYEDVHSLRVDPHNQRRWFAVTGRGLYKTEDGGEQWQKLMEGLPRWYTIGLALNPVREGEVLVAAGDRPPSIGVHVAHSTDAGASWRDVTEEVFSGEAAEARGRLAPVPFFFLGQALLGTDTGHIVCSGPRQSEGGEGWRGWRVLCRLPHPVLCMAAQGQSPSSTMH